MKNELNNYPDGMSSSYIMDHYQIGPRDLICHFSGKEVRVLNDGKALENPIVKIRITHIAKMIEDHLDTSKYNINVIMPICLSDKSDTKNRHVPSLVFSKEAYSNNILIPSYDQLIGYHGEIDHINMINKPFFHKRDQMCFVGSLTNIGWNGAGIEHNQRLKVLNLSTLHPDKLFAKIVRPPNFDDSEWNGVMKEVSLVFPKVASSPEAWSCLYSSEKVPLSDQIRYKFQISIDGHTSTWGRLPWQLMSQSVVIKVRNDVSDYVEWWHQYLKNGEHLFEVDFNSLIDFYEWIVREPNRQYEVAVAGRQFAEKYLSHESCLEYFFLTLSELTKKQKLQSHLLHQGE